MSRLTHLSLHALLIFSLLTCFTRASESSQLKVKLGHGGELVGLNMTSLNGRQIRAFLGVPYAKPPVGELRFQAPVPYGAWSGERLAQKVSNVCPQIEYLIRSDKYIGNEDCLYLNVYTPKEPSTDKALPVMVWIHGGAFFMGSTLMYTPQFLLDKDIVLVSLNYRLGPLGFLSTETLDCPGNNGLKDQKTALEWVKQNIAAFGGDPNSVTIFGESAGGASVTYHMMSEKSKGLFHKAIAQSGTFLNPWAKPSFSNLPAKFAQKLAEFVGCDVSSNNWSNILKCMRTKPAEKISSVLPEFFKWDIDPLIIFKPVIEPEHDDAFLTYSTSIQEPASVPLLLGFNTDEGLLRTASIANSPNLLDDLKQNFNTIIPIELNYDNRTVAEQNEITKALIDFYFKDGINFDNNNFQNLTNMFSDVWFILGIDEHVRSRLAVKDSAPTYFYEFKHKVSASFVRLISNSSEYYGVCHFDEVFSLFQIFPTATERDSEVREAMVNMWVDFASTGNPTPSHSKLTKWMPVKNYPPTIMLIGSQDEHDPVLRMSEEYPLERLNFWKNLKL